MGWWLGRKSAPADARPFVPAWLCSDTAEEGFARSYETQFEEVYRRNPVGQRAVRLVAGMLGSLTVDGPSTSSGQAAVALVKSGLLETITARRRRPEQQSPLASCSMFRCASPMTG